MSFTHTQALRATQRSQSDMVGGAEGAGREARKGAKNAKGMGDDSM